MRRCEQCGRALNRGSTAGAHVSVVCLVCQVEEAMRDWRYQPSYTATNARDRHDRNRVQYHKRKVRASWK